MMSRESAVKNWTKGSIGAAKTFQLQSQLPALPLPNLDDTLSKYLKSIKPFATEDEICHSKSVVENFRDGIGPRLHEKLAKKAKNERNWIAKWWDDVVYLLPRYPIFPLINFGGISPQVQWSPMPGTQLSRAATVMHLTMLYWDELRHERVQVLSRREPVAPLCMKQFKSLFSNVQIPKRGKDELVSYFLTHAEDPNLERCPSHIVVLCKGTYWWVECLDENGQIYSAAQFLAALLKIQENASRIVMQRKSSFGVGTLTCLDRDSWADLREHLLKLDPANAENLDVIGKAVLFISLTDENPVSENDAVQLSVAGQPQYQWADKSMTWHVHKNGVLTSNCNHSPNEAIVMVAFSNYVDEQLLKSGFVTPDESCALLELTAPHRYKLPTIRHLQFKTDAKIEAGIAKAWDTWGKFGPDILILILHHDVIGRKWCRAFSLYSDTVIQLACQLAYFRLHSRPAPTYETASTKQFFHGRSETMRSCTEEAVAWAKSMLGPSCGLQEKRSKFDEAYKEHNRLMSEAQNGMGVDRHLLGLRLQAELDGLPTPAIFNDPMWTRSGGDGNYLLSTSFLGSTNVYGGVAPMCLDGYGAFYNCTEHAAAFFFTTYKSSHETNVSMFCDSVIWSLKAIRDLVESTTVPKSNM